jgi:uncharacterized protein YdaU (DUF1376 family)
MSARPYHKRYHSDALAGFMALTLEERGAYQTLLDLIYDRGGPLPDNERLLAGYMGVSIRKWRVLLDELIAKRKIVRNSDGHLTNRRAEREIENDAKTTRKLAENGSKGGRKKAENEKNGNENNEGGAAALEQEASLNHIPESKDQNKKERKNNPPGGGYAFDGSIIRLTKPDFDRWAKAYPDLDLMAKLQSRDDWLRNEADPKLQQKWFVATSNWLSNEQQKAKAAEKEAEHDPMAVWLT